MSDDLHGYWIGHPGALVSIQDQFGSLNRSTDRTATLRESAGGVRRAYLSARRTPLRQWQVTIPRMAPDQIAPVHDLLVHTAPPYVWVDPWARVTNLLTPAAAGLRSILPELEVVGRQPLEGGGYAPTAVVNPTLGDVRVQPAPVVPDLAFTVSAFLASPTGGRVRAIPLDSAGNPVGPSYTSPTVVGTDVLRRTSVTVPVSDVRAGVAAVELRCLNASVIAQPAVTWTADLLEYGSGGGVTQVVVTGFGEAIQWATLTPSGQRWADLSFTVTEVG